MRIELAKTVEEVLTEEAPSEAEVAAAALRAEIARQIDTELPQLADQPLLEVRATPEGMLISLTDAADFGMFAIGSAEPRPKSSVCCAPSPRCWASVRNHW